MSQTEELLALSIIYRTLINDIEAVAMDGMASFSPTEKHQMVEMVSEAVGSALNHYTLRCSVCDRPIDPICDECIAQQEVAHP